MISKINKKDSTRSLCRLLQNLKLVKDWSDAVVLWLRLTEKYKLR